MHDKNWSTQHVLVPLSDEALPMTQCNAQGSTTINPMLSASHSLQFHQWVFLTKPSATIFMSTAHHCFHCELSLFLPLGKNHSALILFLVISAESNGNLDWLSTIYFFRSIKQIKEANWTRSMQQFCLFHRCDCCRWEKLLLECSLPSLIKLCQKKSNHRYNMSWLKQLNACVTQQKWRNNILNPDESFSILIDVLDRLQSLAESTMT